MNRLWLIFSQAVTVFLALIFVISTLKPLWIKKFFTPLADKVLEKENYAVITESTQLPNIKLTPPKYDSKGFRKAAKKAIPSVVHILARQQNPVLPSSPFFSDPLFQKFFFNAPNPFIEKKNSALGSGVILKKNGLIITNYHVIKDVTSIEVVLSDGRVSSGAIVGVDPETDLAVVKIQLDSLSSIKFANPDSLNVGDFVLAIGNPFGVGQTMTQGIVSALGRDTLNLNTFENFIQTDAAINPGNSGGALVDSSGKLVGINTAIYSKTGSSVGIGFAIPIETVRFVTEKIVEDGEVLRGFVGIQLADFPTAVDFNSSKNISRAFIRKIVKDAPADKAGMRPGDFILAIDNQKVKSSKQLLKIIAQQKPGTSTNILIRRGKRQLTVKVFIKKRPLLR
jgi:serine protease DegQ